MSNEIEIRSSIKNILKDNFDGIIIDEFGLPRTRPDVVLLSEKYFIAIEIKSDKDTLNRLDSQIRDYTIYFDSVIVIVDIIHKNKIIDKHGLHDSSFYYYENGDIYNMNGYKLKEMISPNNSRYLVQKKLSPELHKILWAEERRQLLKPIGGCPNTREFNALLYCFTTYELDRYSRELILSRWEYLSHQEKRFNPGYKGGKLKDKIKHIEHKKVLLEEFKNHKE
ncbi:MAG: sce7726 family protein [Sulfurovaceae bacterium]|nr:sce7726 family protein [Sulfurovaceae bacterium]